MSNQHIHGSHVLRCYKLQCLKTIGFDTFPSGLQHVDHLQPLPPRPQPLSRHLCYSLHMVMCCLFRLEQLLRYTPGTQKKGLRYAGCRKFVWGHTLATRDGHETTAPLVPGRPKGLEIGKRSETRHGYGVRWPSLTQWVVIIPLIIIVAGPPNCHPMVRDVQLIAQGPAPLDCGKAAVCKCGATNPHETEAASGSTSSTVTGPPHIDDSRPTAAFG